MQERKCVMCRGHAIYIDDSNEILQYVNEDGTFVICTYAEAWEICKEIGDPDRLPHNATYLMKDDEYVGRIRGLD